MVLGQRLGETYTATWSGRPENKQRPGPKALPRDALSNRDEAGPHGLAGVGGRGVVLLLYLHIKGKDGSNELEN